MTTTEELFAVAHRMEIAGNDKVIAHARAGMKALDEAVAKVGRAFSGSWLGYHAFVYYEDLKPPPPGAHFSQEWGLMHSRRGTRGDWCEFDRDGIVELIKAQARNPNLDKATNAAVLAISAFEVAKSDALSILSSESDGDQFLSGLTEELKRLDPMSVDEIVLAWAPSGSMMTRDSLARGQGILCPPHLVVGADVAYIDVAVKTCAKGAGVCRKAASHLERKTRRTTRDSRIGTNVFIGHGRSAAWRELKDFIETRLELPWDEFNRVPVAGVTNQARLSEMLDAAAVALS